jgi:CubicO group peptidase (beta-lactamase class C family)
MHDDELKALWRAQRIEPAPPLPDAEQLAEMERKTKALDRTILWRDRRENSAALLVMAIFGVYFFVFPTLLARIGCVIVILSSLVVMAYPMWRKRRVPKAAPEATMTEALESELRKVEVEIALLRSVLWWYILPGCAGVIVFVAGLSVPIAWPVIFTLCVIALDAFIYRINQKAVDQRLLPLKRELESLLRGDDTAPPPEIPRKYIMAKLIMLVCGLLLAGFIGYLIAHRGGAPRAPGFDDVSGPGESDIVQLDGGLQEQFDRAPEAPPVTHSSDRTSQMLEEIRVKHKFPALAASVIVDGNIVATEAVGFRRHGGTEKVTADDKFHVGSVTKSMTATVAAMLVEQGKISWTTTIGESFPELRNDIHADYLGVTLEQLLAHRGGAPASPPTLLWAKAWEAKGTPAEQRLAFIEGILARKPEAQPGTKKIYSNQGYTIAGVMLEGASGKTWEELMRSMLFEPLQMTSAGFGAPATPDKIDQPWGHTRKTFTGIQAVPPGPRADNPLAISPAGAVHCSLGDLAKYAAFHIAGARGKSTSLKSDMFKKLHSPVSGDDYALGWIVLERKWAGGRALMHNGSNTMFYIVVWMAPERNCAVIVATNIGGGETFAGCDEAAGKLIQQFFPK